MSRVYNSTNPGSHNDAKFGHQGAIVLVIDENLAEGLENKTLEIESNIQGNRLVLVE